jgi:hypothetical protein
VTSRTAVTGAAPKKAAAGPQAGGRPFSRAVLWTGIALGAFLATEALLHGLVLPLGLNAIVSAAITFALIVALAVVLAELTRRHHKAAAGHAIRHGKRGAAATARHARRHGSAARAWLVSKAGPRWENRPRQPLMFRMLREAEIPAQAPGAAVAPHQQPSEEGRSMILNLTGRHTGPGFPDHTFAECSPELCGEQRGALARQYGRPSTGGIMSASKISPERRARRNAARAGGTVPSEWGPVIAATADFEPEDDGELLEWMTRQLTGLSGWAEALVDFYEHCTQVIGIDPKASAMLHDVADAAAQAAETMGAAKAKFSEHYELPREFAANGGLMTHDGRWVTGEGA